MLNVPSHHAPTVAAELGAYTTAQTLARVCVTYRQLDYWTRPGLIAPELAVAAGSGTARLWSFENLVELAVVKSLLDLGMALPRVRSLLADNRPLEGELLLYRDDRDESGIVINVARIRERLAEGEHT